MTIAADIPLSNDARFWDKIADKYASSKVNDQAGYEKTLSRTAEFLWPEADVIELGCGTGTTALHLAPNLNHLTATDFSPAMIEIAKSKQHNPSGRNVEFQVATAQTLVSQNQQYDAVLGFNYLHLVPDLEETLSDIHALLKPGGLFISKTPCLRVMNPLIRLAIPVMKFFGKAPKTVHFLSEQELAQSLISAQFEIEEQEFHNSKGKPISPFFVARRI